MVYLVALGLVLALGLTGLIVRRHIARRFLGVIVTGHSMTPTFTDGQRVVARLGLPPVLEVGAVIVFVPPHAADIASDDEPTLRIKRVAALGGAPVPAAVRAATGIATVPRDHVVIVGDNPASEDSRHLGFIPVTNIVAHVPESHSRTRQLSTQSIQ